MEGLGFGTLPVMNLPYGSTGQVAASYQTIADFLPAFQWDSPNSACQMYILKWSDTSILVVPNVETGATNGMDTALSLLTESNPLA